MRAQFPLHRAAKALGALAAAALAVIVANMGVATAAPDEVPPIEPVPHVIFFDGTSTLPDITAEELASLRVVKNEEFRAFLTRGVMRGGDTVSATGLTAREYASRGVTPDRVPR